MADHRPLTPSRSREIFERYGASLACGVFSETAGVEHLAPKFKEGEVTVKLLCETLAAGGKSALDDLIKETGVPGKAARSDIASAMDDTKACEAKKDAAPAAAPTSTCAPLSARPAISRGAPRGARPWW